MLERVWRKGNPHTLLVGMQTSTATMENSISSVQLLSRVQLFATPWIAACQASLSITNSQSLLKLMSIESMMPSNHLILCCPLLLLPLIFPSIRVFSNESALGIRCPGYSVSASASVLPMNIQGSFPLEWTDLILLLSKGLSRVFSSTTIWKHQFFSAQLSLWSNSYMCILLLESLNILEINLLSVASFANIVPHSVGCLLSCLWYPVLYKSF